ncbi:MAG: hypothetical protein PV344_08315 [Anaplasma sp.]|nr:hypothetical protein [Anaplasma sp.]
MRHAATFNSHYVIYFSHIHFMRDITFHVSFVGGLKFPREVMWL